MMIMAQLNCDFGALPQFNGINSLLRILFSRKKLQLITTEDFKQFLEDETGVNLTPLFNQFVYNQGSADKVSWPEELDHDIEQRAGGGKVFYKRPRAFTDEEIKRIV
jgi:hypothetical protein